MHTHIHKYAYTPVMKRSHKRIYKNMPEGKLDKTGLQICGTYDVWRSKTPTKPS